MKYDYNIIIDCRNTYDYVEMCLSSIFLDKPNNINKEIYLTLVDGSNKHIGCSNEKDEVRRMIPDSFENEGYKYVDMRVENGIENNYAKLYNAGYNEDAEFTVFLNGDTIVNRNWLNLFLDDYYTLSKVYGDKVGMLGAKSNNISGRQNIHDCSYRDIILSNRIVTTCAFIKTRVWKEVGLFDEKMNTWMWHDDELSYRLLKAGYHNAVSLAYIHHYGSSATARAKLNQIRDDYNAKEYLKIKYKDELERFVAFGRT